MSKAILVIDMPEICIDCPLSYFERGTPNLNLVCGPTQEDVNNIGKPNWCPLREIPQKQVTNCTDTAHHRYAKSGYNACINEILKGSM